MENVNWNSSCTKWTIFVERIPLTRCTETIAGRNGQCALKRRFHTHVTMKTKLACHNGRYALKTKVACHNVRFALQRWRDAIATERWIEGIMRWVLSDAVIRFLDTICVETMARHNGQYAWNNFLYTMSNMCWYNCWTQWARCCDMARCDGTMAWCYITNYNSTQRQHSLQ